jgi:hypothetical protein
MTNIRTPTQLTRDGVPGVGEMVPTLQAHERCGGKRIGDEFADF